MNERFPQLRDNVVWLFERDEIFRDLCEDYEACAEAADRLKACGSGKEHLLPEYAALRLRLERELLQYLEEHPGRDEP